MDDIARFEAARAVDRALGFLGEVERSLREAQVLLGGEATSPVAVRVAFQAQPYPVLSLAFPCLPPQVFRGPDGLPVRGEAYRRVRSAWRAGVVAEILAARRAGEIPAEFRPERALVRFEAFLNRARDVDNLAVKFVLDGLVEAGVLPDDNCGRVVLLLEGRRSSSPALRVDVADLVALETAGVCVLTNFVRTAPEEAPG